MAKIEIEPSEYANENGHQWVKIKSENILNGKHSCKDCGILRRPDGRNKPCRGKVKIELRTQN